MTDCPFCNPDNILLENDLAFAKYDQYPVSPGHVLVMPKRHTASWFDLTAEEQTAMFVLANQAKKLLDERYAPAGYSRSDNHACPSAYHSAILR